ncbi:serine/threonine-protein phosphatase 6 regulatory ankyrin repeat subunit B-like [Watersipora subatra]|uniref:serine/threonine-protein phosphatase 6 regulatory ankyrin repeat subunit B-like n=1 Tax=Watersipora subatra TaxID=2589382 RepID=UPI00355C219C
MEQWMREYIRASGAPDITSLRAALTTTPPDQLLQLITTIRDSESYTALLLAISRDHPVVAQLLLTPLRGIADELLFEKGEGGDTALHWAVEKGDRELVELILHTVSSSKKYELIAEKDGWGWTALTEAALSGYTEIVESLLISLSVEQRVSLLNIHDINRDTALHMAAYMGQTTALQSMLTSIPPNKVSALLSIKNDDTHSATYQKFAALHKADKQKSKALTNQGAELAESKQQIGALQEEDNRKTAALTNQREELTKLKEELVESKQQIVDLQEADNRKTAELVLVLTAAAGQISNIKYEQFLSIDKKVANRNINDCLMIRSTATAGYLKPGSLTCRKSPATAPQAVSGVTGTYASSTVEDLRQSRGRLLNEGRRYTQAIKDMKQPASISPTEYLQDTMEQWIREYIRASGAPDITSLRAALTTTPPDQLLQLITTIRYSESYTALLLAISRGHPVVTHMLLTPLRGIADELLFVKDVGGCTALYWAVWNGDRELVELILHTVSSGRKYELIAEKGGDGWTALTRAAYSGYTEIVDTLLISLSVEQRVSLLNIQNISRDTALHWAAYKGHTAVIQTMLTSIPPDKVSALLSIKNRDSRTPLEEAESGGIKETVELLKSWKRPALAAHAAPTFWRFASLHEADRHKTKAHAAATDEEIAVLHEADRHKTKELTKIKEELVESQRQIVALKEADNRKTAGCQLTLFSVELASVNSGPVANKAV